MTRSELILHAALEAGKAISSIEPSDATVIDKEGRGNYVTLADKTSEQIIFTQIRKQFPTDIVLSEETESSLNDKELLNQDHLWMIDPIDGTTNYQHGRKYSSVSIGYAKKGILTLGVVYDPFREELFTAEKGNGSFHNGKKMHVSKKINISDASIITDNAYDPAIIREHLETILKLPETPWIIMKGSFALEICEVAGGQSDLIFGFCPKPWDIAAGLLILEEAGGIYTTRYGKPTNFLTHTLVGGTPAIVKEFLQYTR